ncbi:hypothetical protein T01_2129 [Trichinella spiralis]|uniref:Uncharacterized protein n=1 Tax=Trichinella spiralis TaxID=6334 RepID=A0A0V1AU05_TRISP|nr:hypothetical protein T01_2129 [Trichinella spiralis]
MLARCPKSVQANKSAFPGQQKAISYIKLSLFLGDYYITILTTLILWAICSFLVFHFNEYGCAYLTEDTIKSMTTSWKISRLYVCFIPHHQHANLQNYRLTAALGNYSFLVRHFNEYGSGYLAEDTIKSMTTSWTISRLYVCFIPHHQHAILQLCHFGQLS